MSAPRDRSQRAQTAQDFAVGISIFLLAVAFVFAFVPQTLPEDGGQETSQQSLADRAAATIIADTSLPEEANTLDAEQVESYLSAGWPNATLNSELGLPTTVQVNVTFRHLNGSRVEKINDENATIGDVFGDEQQTISLASRIVQFDETDEGVCTETPCRLVVRVW